MIGGTLVFFGITITFWVFQFEWFVYHGGAGNCSFNQGMLALCVVMSLILFVLPIAVGNGSIFTTGIVAFYITYLTYSALEGSPDAECNSFAGEQSSLSMWLGFLITAAAISYTGFSVSRNQNKMTDGSDAIQTKEIEMGSTKRKTSESDLGTSNYDDAVDKDEVDGGDKGEDVSEKKANVTFHVCMAFAAIYMCMLYTGWGDDQVSTESKARGWTSVYVNLVCVWLTVLMYGWTVIAPKVCPGRFSMEADEDDDKINMDI